MLTQIFKSVLLMSSVGSILAAFWLLLKPVTQKLFSPRWQYYIWLTVLIVMILPVRFSASNRTPNVSTVTVNQTEKFETELPQENNQIADMQISKQTEKISISKPKLPQNILYYFAYVWFLGMIAVLLAKIIKYNLFLRTIYKNSAIYTDIPNIPKRLAVRKTAMLDAPLIVGIFKPALFLPNTEISENDMNYILMHELTHYKRGDLFYKWFAMAVLSVHWFNPLAYIVSRQIDTECEVSCDFAVTSKLSEKEKSNYMNMILKLLSCSKNSFEPLTTQMVGNKKTIKRRFCMIKNKKATSKFMSVISAFAATIMLSTTIFASGILSDFATDDYTINILNNGERIEFTNKPFIENGEIYVPLRETLEKAMPKDKGVVDIEWNDGTIDVTVAYYQGTSGKYQLKIGKEFVKLQHISYEDYKKNSVETSMIVTALSLKQPPILKDSITYVTLKDINYMLYGYTIRRDENNLLCELTYTVYGKNGEIIMLNSAPKPLNSTVAKTYENDNVVTEYYEYNTPEYTVSRFFAFFADGHFETMKNYCTQNCINTYFKDNSVFGMEKAVLTETNIAPTEYLKSSNDFNIFVSVTMTPSKTSVFDPKQKSTSFYVILERQSDGRYLIDSFATGI